MYITRGYDDVIQALDMNIGDINRGQQEKLPDNSDVESVIQISFQPQYFIYTKLSIYFVSMDATHKWQIEMIPR